VPIQWRHFLRGLSWSGLRIGESLELDWDRPNKLRPMLAREDSCLVIPAELEKGNTDRIIAMAAEFVEFLEQTPTEQRRGPVFRPLRKSGGRANYDYADHTISEIGKVAGVIVEHDADGKPKKFASAHDFRRAFAERWSKRILPGELQELMRHKSIITTMTFYVGQNAKRTANAVWAAYRKNHDDTPDDRQQKCQHRASEKRSPHGRRPNEKSRKQRGIQ
jgi:integrase